MEELKLLGEWIDEESIFTMLASESILREDWDNKLDEKWNNLRKVD